jgi:hypothetical protein
MTQALLGGDLGATPRITATPTNKGLFAMRERPQLTVWCLTAWSVNLANGKHTVRILIGQWLKGTG